MPPTPSSAATRLADLPLRAVRRSIVTTVLLLVVVVLFLAMVWRVLIAAFLGIVVGVYLRPVYCWLADRLDRKAPAAILTIIGLLVPALAILIYGYLEVREAALYLSENAADVAAQIQATLRTLPFISSDAQPSIEPLLVRIAEYGTKVPEGIQDALGALMVAGSVFLFTAFYVLTEAEAIIDWVRDRVPRHYADLTTRMETHAQGVLYGAIYATVVSQSLKALLMLVLLFAFGVPIPFTLAIITFVIGFFPVVGTWTVFLPAGGYLLVFQDAPWQALALVVIGFVMSTIVISLYLRPRMAAKRSRVLNFYWMFLGLIAGVYTFGVPGIVLGPLVIGLLKAIVDTITHEGSWGKTNPDPAANGEEEVDEDKDAKVFTGAKLQGGEPAESSVEEDR